MTHIRLVRRTNQITVNVKPAADAMAAAIAKRMQDRIAAGVDANGARFPKYSDLYREQKEITGQSPEVTISSSRSLLQDLKALRVEVNGADAVIVFGVGNATSPRTPRPPPWVLSRKQSPEKRARAIERWKASQKKASQSLPHVRVLEELVTGGVGRPARAILGLTADDMSAIRSTIEKAPIFRYG